MRKLTTKEVECVHGGNHKGQPDYQLPVDPVLPIEKFPKDIPPELPELPFPRFTI